MNKHNKPIIKINDDDLNVNLNSSFVVPKVIVSACSGKLYNNSNIKHINSRKQVLELKLKQMNHFNNKSNKLLSKNDNTYKFYFKKMKSVLKDVGLILNNLNKDYTYLSIENNPRKENLNQVFKSMSKNYHELLEKLNNKNEFKKNNNFHVDLKRIQNVLNNLVANKNEVSVNVKNNVNVKKVGNYNLTYTAKDNLNQVSSKKVNVSVRSTTGSGVAPTLNKFKYISLKKNITISEGSQAIIKETEYIEANKFKIINNGTLKINGSLKISTVNSIENNGNIVINGTLINDGNINVPKKKSLINNGKLMNNNTLSIDGSLDNNGICITNKNGSINNTENGKLNNNGSLVVYGNFNNKGTLNNKINGEVCYNGTINNKGGIINNNVGKFYKSMLGNPTFINKPNSLKINDGLFGVLSTTYTPNSNISVPKNTLLLINTKSKSQKAKLIINNKVITNKGKIVIGNRGSLSISNDGKLINGTPNIKGIINNRGIEYIQNGVIYTTDILEELFADFQVSMMLLVSESLGESFEDLGFEHHSTGGFRDQHGIMQFISDDINAVNELAETGDVASAMALAAATMFVNAGQDNFVEGTYCADNPNDPECAAAAAAGAPPSEFLAQTFAGNHFVEDTVQNMGFEYTFTDNDIKPGDCDEQPWLPECSDGPQSSTEFLESGEFLGNIFSDNSYIAGADDLAGQRYGNHNDYLISDQNQPGQGPPPGHDAGPAYDPGPGSADLFASLP